MDTNNFKEIFEEYFSTTGNNVTQNYLHKHGKSSHALMYSFLYMPGLIEVGSSVFFKNHVFDLEKLMHQLINADVTSQDFSKFIEGYNWEEVPYMFAGENADLSDEEEEKILAPILKDSWEAWLRYKYPNYTFQVRLMPMEETGSTIGVGFSQETEESPSKIQNNFSDIFQKAKQEIDSLLTEEKEILQIFKKCIGPDLNYSVYDYIHAYGEESKALLYSTLFFPEFVETEKRIFLKKNVTENEELKNALNDIPGEQIELQHNLINLRSLFEGENNDLSKEEEKILAKRIRDAWDAWLHYQYPSRKFIVKVLETTNSYGVTFHEVRQN